MIWLMLFTSCQLAWTQAKQGVYHELSASWFKVPLNNTAYFGYSITYVPSSKRLIVSAPQADNIGEIYSCDLITGTNECTSLLKNTFRFDNSYRHNYWLGATVKAGPSYFVTCSPLYAIRQKLEINKKQVNGTYKPQSETAVGTFSKCYKYTDLSKYPVNLTSIKDRTTHATLFEHAMDSFGWSIDVDGDDFIIGGPALFTGRAVKYDKRLNPISLTGFMDQNNGTNYERRVEYNFGYSVAVGHFIIGDDKKNTKSYAIGSPYGTKGYGKVSFYFFSNNKAYLNVARSTKSREDLQTNDKFAVGSMFGAVLCAARLTAGSSATALLVGAPTYASTQQYNQGAVYVYPPASKLPLKECVRKIVGTGNGGFFGSAIVRLGDYNGDGLDEIAIAAPYAHAGAGVVYIYSGADVIRKNGEITWMQRIIPRTFVRSFGLSLTAVEDYDENGCNELAIGAPESNAVMMLKCIAAVTVNLYTEIPNDLSLRNDNQFRNETSFTFRSCFKIKYPEKPNVIYAHIKVSVQVDHPDVNLAPIDKTYDVYLNRAENVTCRNITVLAPKNGKYQQPIKYKIDAQHVANPDGLEFNASHVAFSDRSTLTYSGLISLAECGDVNQCKPDLKLIKSLSVTSPYVIGSSEKINLFMSVSNKGEAAYEACVQVFAEGVDVAVVPRGCERLQARLDALLCRPPGALRKEDKAWDIPEIPFDSSQLTSENKNIKISIDLYNNCNQGKPEPLYEEILLKPDLSKILIKGITDSGVSNAVNMSKDDVEGKTFEHSYTITSGGLTNWVNVEVKVERQNRSFIEYGPIYMTSGSQNEQCSMETDNDFACVIDELNSKQSVKITVPMKIINPEMLNIAIREQQNTQLTSLSLKLNEEETRGLSLTTTFNLVGQVQIWIIVVASLVALLILLLIFLILRRCGFFKRNKKAKLENVRKSVRRQTIMRRTMMEGVRLVPESDQQSLLASVSQETADQAAARDKRVRLDSNATRNKVG